VVRRSVRVGLVAVLVSLVVLALASIAVAAPSNDDYSSPVLLMGGSGSVAASNTDATVQEDEPSGSAWADGATVWFAWDAPESGTLDLGANADLATTHVAVYAGTPSVSSEPVASDYSGVRFDVDGGTRYFISIDTEGI